MENSQAMSEIIDYRNNLITYGKRVIYENPDKLTNKELQALTDRIFNELNAIDTSCGYPYHYVGTKLPDGISKEKQEILYFEFIDWYQVISTPSGLIYDYVTQEYSLNKYPKVLCVGDGENCHLGKKLAMKGYKVVSVDPVAKKQFSGKYGDKGGTLHVVAGEFFKTSKDMIDWANLIVGTKVPICAEEIIESGKSAVFNISSNAEIYNMRFKGNLITSSQQLVEEIAKCPRVSLKQKTKNSKSNDIIFVCEEKENEREI